MKLGIETLWEDRKRILGMPISFTKYYLSKDRLFMQHGFFNMHMEEIVLYRVTDISLHVTLWQRIFGVGTVLIHSSDKSTPHLEIKSIRDPMVVKELLHKNVEEMKQQRGVHVNEFLDDGPNAHDPCMDIV